MTVYRKCRTCTKNGDCLEKEALRKAIKGLHITSVLHNCPNYSAPFQPGEPILYGITEYDGDGYGEGYEVEYPGHFIGHVGARAMIYVRPGVEDIGEDGFHFAPRANGFCKVSFDRLSPNPNDDPVKICSVCQEPEGVRDTCAYFGCPTPANIAKHI